MPQVPTQYANHQMCPRKSRHADPVSPSTALTTIRLPLLSLPLPAPRRPPLQKFHASDISDPDPEIRTPTLDQAQNAPFPPTAPPNIRYGSSKLNPIVETDKVNNLGPLEESLGENDTAKSLVIRIEELNTVIEGVYTAYMRLAKIVQSPLIIASLLDFRYRARDLVRLAVISDRARVVDGFERPFALQTRLETDDLKAGLLRLEAEWWDSEVVANWFGPQPQVVSRRGQARRKKGQEGNHLILTEKADELRRTASFVGLWDE